MMRQIGWAIESRVDPRYKIRDVRVYATRDLALRYSSGLPVIPVFVPVDPEAEPA